MEDKKQKKSRIFVIFWKAGEGFGMIVGVGCTVGVGRCVGGGVWFQTKWKPCWVERSFPKPRQSEQDPITAARPVGTGHCHVPSCWVQIGLWVKEAGHVLHKLKLVLAVQVRDKALAAAWHHGWDYTLEGGDAPPVFPLNNQICQRRRGKEFC